MQTLNTQGGKCRRHKRPTQHNSMKSKTLLSLHVSAWEVKFVQLWTASYTKEQVQKNLYRVSLQNIFQTI